MANTRFKGANSSERLTLSTLSDSDMFQTRHLPGTVNDADKGVSKSLLQALPVAVCATAAATAAKVMTLAPESCPDFTLVNGRVIHVYFSAANTASTPTANVAGTGAIPIVYPSGDFVGNWAAGVTMDLMYISITVDNTAIERWVVVSSLPVDTVAVDNMNSVTSNAVAAKFNTVGEEKSGSVTSGTYTSNGTFKSENCGSITLTKGKWIVIFTMQYNGNMNTGYVIGCAIDSESYRVRVATAGIDRTLEIQCAGIVSVTSSSRSVDLRVFHHLTVDISSNSFVKAIRIQ